MQDTPRESLCHELTVHEIKNYFTIIMDRIGVNFITVLVFMYCNLLNSIWGAEATFLSINLQNLAKNQQIDEEFFSVLLCLIYMVICIGSLLVGFVPKLIGRKLTLLLSIILYISCTIVGSIWDDFYLVYTFRCMGNVSIGIFSSLSVNILAEYLPTKNRCFYLMITSGCYNIGAFYCTVINFVIQTDYPMEDFKYVNLLLLIPCIVCLLLHFFVEESPIMLFSEGKDKRAFVLLSRLCLRSGLNFTEEDKRILILERESNQVFTINSSFIELFSNKFRKLTIICLIICVVSYLNMIASTYLAPVALEKLAGRTIEMSSESQLLIFGLVQCPNGIFGAYMSESKLFARKRTMWVSAIICSFFYFLIVLFPYLFCVEIGFVLFFNSVGFGVIYIYIAEAFPTKLRDQAQSFLQTIGYIVGSWAPYFIFSFQDHIETNFIVFGCTYILCFIATFFLPFETKDRPLDFDE